jgi:predicted amidophosphoribosyltransferase
MRVRPEAKYVLDVGYEVVVDGKKRFVSLPESIPLDEQILKMAGPRLAEAAKNLAPGESRPVDLDLMLVRAHPETGILPRHDLTHGGNGPGTDGMSPVRPFPCGWDVSINPVVIKGNWTSGIALDLHTTRSVFLGLTPDGEKMFDTTSPDLGRLLYELKSEGQQPAAFGIVAAAVECLRPYRENFDLVIPAPPSEPRAIQPVTVLANGIAGELGLPVATCVAKTQMTRPFKGLSDEEKLRELEGGVYAVDPLQTRGKSVLVIDDIVESGATLNAITDALFNEGGCKEVWVMAVTKARNGSCPTG